MTKITKTKSLFSPKKTDGLKSTLILDLDNTLVHALSSKERKKKYDLTTENNRMRKCNFIVDCGDNCFYYVYKRPGVDNFLKRVCEVFDYVIVWSAGSEDYVNPTVEKLFKNQEKKPRYIISQETFGMIEKDIENLIKSDPKINQKQLWFMDDIPERILNLPEKHIITVPPFTVDKIDTDDYLFGCNFIKK